MKPKYGLWPELEHPQPSDALYLRGITLYNFLAQNTEYHRAEKKIEYQFISEIVQHNSKE